ncbi:MAG: molybdopterin-dependent oxidoreductase, partial [Dehalococcoidia bacterium]|nr:molybdopterin-dependent oxidoreductase [Dehalococcoidia bacterium]
RDGMTNTQAKSATPGGDGRRLVRTMCGIWCHPTMCGMEVEVRDGRVVNVRGDHTNPDSKGFLCIRGQSAPEIVHSPHRLRRPLLRRDGDKWETITWEQALDLIAERMIAAGRERVGLWVAHGAQQNGLGVRLANRFSNMYGCQRWLGAIFCWGFGAAGLALTGILNVHTKEDLAANSRYVLLWGANFAGQPHTARNVMAAKKRGARLATIDCRVSEAARQSDDVLLVRPGTDAALALAMIHVIIAEGLHDTAFIEQHTVGFAELAEHVRDKTPEWAASITGVSPADIREMARAYATTKPAVLVVGASSMAKSANGWLSTRAISCLPALTGNLGIPGGGIGPRHAAACSGDGLADITAPETRPPGDYFRQQMSYLPEAVSEGKLRVLLILGSNLLSMFPDSSRLEETLRGLDLVVTHDLFLTETTRRVAHLALPGTSWLEEQGVRCTNTYVHLMEQALEPVGEARSNTWVLKEMARRLGIDGFYPWRDHEDVINALLRHPATGGVTVSDLRCQGGRAPLAISHVAYPDFKFHTPSGKVEFWSQRCVEMGLPPLPEYHPPKADETLRSQQSLSPRYPLVLRTGRSIGHFHSFYDEGRAVSTLARLNPVPVVWIHPSDAGKRGVKDGDDVTARNERGEFRAQARVTADVLPGVVWLRSGWFGMNRVTSAERTLPDHIVDGTGWLPFPFGQASYEALVEVTPAVGAHTR